MTASAVFLVLVLASGTRASTGVRTSFLERCPKQLPKTLTDALRKQRPRGARLPAFDRARLCGIPASGSRSKAAGTKEVVVGGLPRGVSLPQVKSATRTAVERVQAEVARCYRRAGKRVGPPDDSRIQPATDALLRNQRVQAAAQRLRANALAERTDARAIAEAEAGLSTLVASSYRRLISDFAHDANLQVPARRIACTDSPPRVRKPAETVPVEVSWIELHSVTKGDHASYDQVVYGLSPPTVDLSADVGWDSEATSSAVVQGWFELPTHTSRATIKATYLTMAGGDVDEGMFGESCAFGLATTGVFKLNGGPSTSVEDYEFCPVDLVPLSGAPVPDPPLLGVTETRTMTLVQPPSGFYVAWIAFDAEAWSHGMAAAWAGHFGQIERWEVTLEFE